jgi:hypothetical protein
VKKVLDLRAILWYIISNERQTTSPNRTRSHHRYYGPCPEVLGVRETKEETKKIMTKKQNINWTSYNKLTAEPIKARINRIQRHNDVLGYVIAGLLGASAALTFVIAHMMITGPAWTW